MITWTIAYRKPRANRFLRVALALTWAQAWELAGRFVAANPGLEVHYVTSREAELTGYVVEEDVRNILVESGRRVRIVEGGTCDLEPVSDYQARQRFEWPEHGLFHGTPTTEPPAGHPAAKKAEEPADQVEMISGACARGECGDCVRPASGLPCDHACHYETEPGTGQAPVTPVAPNIVVIRADSLGAFLATVNAQAQAMEDIDRERTMTHANGITQVFATKAADRVAGEPAIGAYRRDGDSYRTYAPDGSSLACWVTEQGAYNAVVNAYAARQEHEAAGPEHATWCAGWSTHLPLSPLGDPGDGNTAVGCARNH
jgi:hypothetical protein